MILKGEREKIVEFVSSFFFNNRDIKSIKGDFIFNDTFNIDNNIIYSLEIVVKKEEFKDKFNNYKISYLNPKEIQGIGYYNVPYYYLLQGVYLREKNIIFKYFVIPESFKFFSDESEIIDFASFLNKLSVDIIKKDSCFILKIYNNKFYIYTNVNIDFDMMDSINDRKNYLYNLINKNYDRLLLEDGYNNVYEIIF